MVSAQTEALKDDQKLHDLIELYNKTEPGELSNELHSILGTEYADLSSDLETYYKQYFTNRAQIVAYQKQYNAEFDASKVRITDYQKQLDALKPQIDANNADLEHRNTEINNEATRLEQLRRTDVAAYNSEVPGYNAKIQEYNRIARDTQALVAQYNAIVVRVKNELALQSDLDHSLDSKYQQVQAPATH
jgi:chromosome segregation ATPase